MRIELCNITKTYRGAPRAALTGLNLSFKSGDVVGIIGNNGSGKSTLLNILSSVITATSGSYLLDGEDITHNPEIVKNRMGYFADPDRALYWRLTARENVDRFCKLKGIFRTDGVPEQTNRLLKRFGLLESAGRQIRTFSKGMKVKLNIILSLLGDNDLLILDEPFAGLDGNVITELLDIVDEQADSGKIILVSSNELSELELLCNRLIVLNAGELVFDGTPRAALDALPGEGVLDVYCMHPEQMNGLILDGAGLHVAQSVLYFDRVSLFSQVPLEDYAAMTQWGGLGKNKVVLREKNLYDVLKKMNQEDELS